MRERRYERLRPAQIRAEMDVCPLIYFPLGPLEWHGPHLPLGTDPAVAYEVALRLCQRTGGLVLPPFFWGTERERTPQTLRDLGFKGDEWIFGMDFPANSLRSLYVREEFFALLVREMLDRLVEQGWKVIAIVNGHGADNQRAVLDRLSAEFSARGPARVVNLFAWASASSAESTGHADGEETAELMAIWPETVDLSTLPPADQPLYNVDWAVVDGPTFGGQPAPDHTVRDDPRTSATRERGERALQESIEWLAAQMRAIVRDTLAG